MPAPRLALLAVLLAVAPTAPGAAAHGAGEQGAASSPGKGPAASPAAAPTFAYLTRDARGQYATLASRSLTKPVSGNPLQDLHKTASQRALTATIPFVAGGGLAVTAAGEAFFTDWHDYRFAFKFGRKSLRLALRGRF